MGRKFFKGAALAGFAVLTAFVLQACSNASPYPMPEMIDSVEYSLDDSYAGGAASFAEDGYSGEQQEVSQAIVKTGDVTLRVNDPAESASKIAQMVTDFGGSIGWRDVSRNSDGVATHASMQLRVPEKSFDETFELLADNGTIIYDQRNETDVSLERADLGARIGALETSIERLTELLSKADTTADLVEIETQLTYRQQELDSYRAQMRVLEDQISLATIQLSLMTDTAIPGGPKNFIDGLKTGLESLMFAASGLVIFAGIALPWVVVVFAIVVLITVIVRVARKKKR